MEKTRPRRLLEAENRLAYLFLSKGAVSFDGSENDERSMSSNVPFSLNFGKIINEIGDVADAYANYVADVMIKGRREDMPLTHVHGPAYSGISLAVLIVTKLKEMRRIWGIRRSYGLKGGGVYGKIEPGAKVLLVDDFIISGRTVRKNYQAVRDAQPAAEVVGCLASLDVRSIDDKGRYVIDGLEEDLGIEIHTVLPFSNMVWEYHGMKTGNDGKVYVDDRAFEDFNDYLRGQRAKVTRTSGTHT